VAISKNLVVKFLGDSSQLQGVYKSVTSDAQKFGREVKNHGVSMQAVGKTMLAVGGTIVGAMAATVVAVSKVGTQIDKYSKQTGVSREEMQKLGYAALQEHASMEQLANGLTKLSKNMYDASTGTGEAAKAFSDIGVNVQTADGHLRNSSDVMLDVAEKFRGMSNESEKSAIAMKIFGKSGADLVPFLNMGRDGIEELKKEAERLGIVMSEDSVKKMKEFDDSITAVKAGVGGLGTQIASTLIPYTAKLADNLKSAVEWFNKIPKPVRESATVGVTLTGVLTLLAGVITTMVIPALSKIHPAIGITIGAVGLLSAGIKYLDSTNQVVAAHIRSAWDRLLAFLNSTWKGLETSVWTMVREALKALNTFTGWIPGWGKGLNAAISAVEKERQASLLAANANFNAMMKGTYQQHYDDLTKIVKNKNKTMSDAIFAAYEQRMQQERQALTSSAEFQKANYATKLKMLKDTETKELANTKLTAEQKLQIQREYGTLEAGLKAQKAKEQTAAEKQAAKEANDKAKQAAQERLNNEKEWREKLFNETHNELEKLNHEEELALSEANMTAKAKADVVAYYDKKRSDLAKSEAKKRTELANEEAKKLADNEKDWTDKVFEITHNELENLNKAEEEALNKENLTEKAKTDIKAYYTQRRKELGDAEVKKALDHQNELLERAQNYSNRLYELTHDEYDNRLKALDTAESKELKQTELTEQEKTDIIDFYAKQRLKVYEDEENSYYKTGLQMAQTFTSFTDSIRDGSTTIGEALQNLLISIINTIEQQVIAKAIAAEAIAYADSWWSFGSSLASLATVASKVWPAVAALEALKFGVSALAEGGLTTGPSVNLIGEGAYPEAVLPLSDEVFAKIGEGIIKNQTVNNDNRTTNSSSPTVVNHYHTYELGKYVDKSGLKKFARDIQPILVSEDRRKGKK